MRRERLLPLGLLAALVVWPSLTPAGENEVDAGAMRAEIEQLRRERSTLESRVLMLQSQLDEVRSSAMMTKNQADVLEKRCRVLQNELKLVKAEKPAADNSAVKKFDPPVQMLPPSSMQPPKPSTAHGRISAIGNDGVLIQISIGSDAGIKEGQMLEVFRLGSASGKERIGPLYLGTLKLIRVDPQASLGHFKSVPGLDRRPKIGDEVANELFVK
jgi:hypothetical protein